MFLFQCSNYTSIFTNSRYSLVLNTVNISYTFYNFNLTVTINVNIATSAYIFKKNSSITAVGMSKINESFSVSTKRLISLF